MLDLISLPRQTIAVLFLLMLLVVAREIAAQNEGASLGQYRALLSESQAALEDGPVDRETLENLAARWSAMDRVVVPDGTTLPIRHDALIAQFRAPEPNAEALRARLDTLEIVWNRWPQRDFSRRSAPEALSQLRQILAQPQFQWPQQGPSLLRQIWDRLLRFLFNLLPEAVTGARPLRALLAGLGILLLLAVLLYAGRALLAAFSPSDERQSEPAGQAEVTADKALNEAEALSKVGDYRMAVRYLYLSALLILDEHGLVRYDRTRTNREYLRTLSDRPELASTLREVVHVFDRVWYGFRAVDHATYSRFEAQVRTLKEMR